MGLLIDRDDFGDDEFPPFSRRLEECLEALRALLEQPDFGAGPPSLGAELELSLVDAECRPCPLNAEVLERTRDPRLTLELDRFNLECNLLHAPLAGRPFHFLRKEIEGAVAEARRAAAVCGAGIAMIGILPTLREEDLQRSAMSDAMRYRALSAALRRIRQEPTRLDIDGDEPLAVPCDDVTFEGAATSLQLHLRVDPREFSDLYNAVQMATAPALAVSTNSPTLLGHRLWEETRVALFKQAVDFRGRDARRARRAARVSFGTRWVEKGPLELFEENVTLHEPLLPILAEEDPLACLDRGEVPRLEEVRLHQGTVWRWNRAIYDPAEGGHFRIEMRALPAGPTPLDMVANAAFLIGTALGLAPEARRYTAGFDFEQAHRSFYRAAQHGLEAELPWPEAPGRPARSVPARDLVLALLPTCRAGLARAGVESDECERLLGIIEARTRSGGTGSRWQRRVLSRLEAESAGDSELRRSRALRGMFERYRRWSELGEPVHEWSTEA